MIALFYVLIIFFGLSHCDDVLSRIEVENSINRTINEVERLIRQNSTLPHLNRREIVDILRNITSKDLEAYKDKQKIEEARKIYQRALMVVLPYNAEDAEESIKDLYTKPPIVEIIADPLHNQENYETWKTAKLQQANKFTLHDEESIKNLVETHTSERTTSKENPPEKTWYKNHKETYSEMNMNIKENLKLDSTPLKFSFNLENLQKQSMTTEEPIITTRQPVYVRSSNEDEDEDVDVIYSTSVTTVRSVATSPKNALIDSKESQTLFRPLKHNENVLSADQWRYHAPTITQSPMAPAKIPNSFKVSSKQPFSSIATLLSENIMAPTVINKIESASETEASEIISEEMEIEDVEQTTSIYVTPMSSSSSPLSEKSNYNSTYNLNLGGFRKITTTTTTMRPEVMDLIASIGLRPENTIHIEKVFEKNKENFENKSQVLDSNGLIYTTTSSLTAGEPDSPSITGQNTFESSVSEIGKGMNNLTPDIQLLFQRFGLQTSNLVTPEPTSTSRPIVNTNSYTNFKLLPASNVKDQDMKEFLARFGLGVSDRHKKAMPMSTERSSLIDVVPDSMKPILENIGLISRKAAPKVESTEPMKITKFHVFKPHEVIIKDEKQKMQINELLDTIRLVQEGKASAKDVRKIANDLLVTTKTLKDGPDPLSLEKIITVYNNDMKNEVKRQQNSQKTVETNSDQDLANVTAASTESMDVSSTTISTTTTMMPSDSAKDSSVFTDTTSEREKEREKESSTSADTNLVALEESFDTTLAPDPILPNKRKSGLYFLVDLNTFLEVGDENSEKVNLRFQPKVGDRTKFLRVSVP
ncbi:enolase-phosphatase E1 [Linepithema humile]|uniref:enolase-phosphatase E1 n=1 Tax=Linepithema humile TaxID=83485 RepID=UPI00351E11C8